MVTNYRKHLSSHCNEIKKPSEIISKGHNHKPIHHRRIDNTNLTNILINTGFF